jgi:hypothetical protein
MIVLLLDSQVGGCVKFLNTKIKMDKLWTSFRLGVCADQTWWSSPHWYSNPLFLTVPSLVRDLICVMICPVIECSTQANSTNSASINRAESHPTHLW